MRLMLNGILEGSGADHRELDEDMTKYQRTIHVIRNRVLEDSDAAFRNLDEQMAEYKSTMKLAQETMQKLSTIMKQTYSGQPTC